MPLTGYFLYLPLISVNPAEGCDVVKVQPVSRLRNTQTCSQQPRSPRTESHPSSFFPILMIALSFEDIVFTPSMSLNELLPRDWLMGYSHVSVFYLNSGPELLLDRPDSRRLPAEAPCMCISGSSLFRVHLVLVDLSVFIF